MRKFSRRTVSILLMVIFVLSVTAGSAWAYFTDYEQLAGQVTINLNGQTTTEEDPGDASKTVWIKNTGTADVIVKVMIYGPKEMTVDDSDDWQITKIEDGVFRAYYKYILPAGEDSVTSTFTARIDKVDKTLIENSEVEITVVQECCIVSFNEDNVVIAPEDWPDFPTIKAE